MFVRYAFSFHTMSKNIVFEGWLTKSPPSKRIWRTKEECVVIALVNNLHGKHYLLVSVFKLKCAYFDTNQKWRRRWFALRQSGELPGQYFLDYYADRNYRRLKGTINLDLCEQVDAGLHMERTGNGSLDPKVRGSVFTIQTQSRVYHLEADSESDMEKWVDAICRVCGLRATDESDELGHYQNNVNANNISAFSEQNETTGPYIPISECRTGVRAQDSQRAFTFDPKNIVTSTTRHPLKSVVGRRDHHMYTSQPQIRLNNPDSENDSTMSDEESKSLNNSQPNIRDYSVAKTFTKLAISPDGESEEGPPVPPRPPKTFAMSKAMFARDTYPGPSHQDPHDIPGPSSGPVSRHVSQGAPPSSPRPDPTASVVSQPPDEDVDYSHYQQYFVPQSIQYSNLGNRPPAVDRNLKPRPASNTTSSATPVQNQIPNVHRREVKADKLQYLDLDLVSPTKKTADGREVEMIHGKSQSDAEADCAYKTVDFLKTEAFNITLQDAEASRNGLY